MTPTHRKPDWLRAKLPSGPAYQATRRLVEDNKLHTVCQSAQCPNIGECWSRGTATVMILGNICTRSCNFCAIQTGRPTEFDLGEPARVADAVAKMGLKHCVITSVARDDMADGGASVWAATIRATKYRNPQCAIEVAEEAVRMQVGAKAPATDYDAWKELGTLAAPPTENLWAKEHLREEDIAQLDLADMIKRKGRAYAAYHRLRISAVSDQLARLIARVAGFDEDSDWFIITRSLVRAWRVKTYVEHRLTPEQANMPTIIGISETPSLACSPRPVSSTRAASISSGRKKSRT